MLSPFTEYLSLSRFNAIRSLNSQYSSLYSHTKLSHPLHLLDEMPERSYKSYNAAIRSCMSANRYTDAVSLFKQMQSLKFRPDSFALAAVIKASSTLSDPILGMALHGFAVKGCFGSLIAVEKALMGMYASFGSLEASCRVFENMGRRDSVSWNVLLSGYARAQLHMEAMTLFRSMHTCDDIEVEPTAITIAVVLPICAKMGLLNTGRNLHSYSIKRGLILETIVANALVSMYAKCGRVVDDARRLFNLIAYRDVISWNSMIAGYSENGFLEKAFKLFSEMVSVGFMPNYATLASVLPICAAVDNGWFYGKEIHCYMLRFGLEADLSVCNALLTHYAKVGDMEGAEFIFNKMYLKDLVTWNTLIAGYATNDRLPKAMELFHDLILSGMKPDPITVITVLPVCAQLLDIKEGRKIHDYILQHPSLHQETSIGNALISFYGKCRELDSAMEIFNGMPNKDLISWNAMLNAFSDCKQWEKHLDLLYQMNQKRIRPDSVTIISVLQGCAHLGMRKVREAHGYSFRAGFTNQPTVGNAILDAYAKCGSIESAFRTFESMVGKNVITGNAMISGYLKHGCQEDAEIIFGQMFDRDLTTWNLMLQVYTQNNSIDQAFDLFRGLQDKGMRPDTVSITCILAACARLASVHLVRQCHGYTIRTSIDDLHLIGALLDTYSKCGSIDDASKLFRASPTNDLVTFTAMVSGLAMHGKAEEAVEIFSQMIQLDIKPDHVILTALLSACSHAGLVDEGWRHFKSITEVHGVEPTAEHYACMVDLLARRGRLREAYDLIEGMPIEANANIWGALLGSCKTHGEVEIGRLAADHLCVIEGTDIGNFVVLSNIYAADGKWDGVEKVRRMMKSRDLRKPAGCSWIEVEMTRHVFVAGDCAHPERFILYDMLGSLDQQTKSAAGSEEVITVNI